eukprot:3654247-Pleurochrysis_carterae.AAC.1
MRVHQHARVRARDHVPWHVPSEFARVQASSTRTSSRAARRARPRAPAYRRLFAATIERATTTPSPE